MRSLAFLFALLLFFNGSFSQQDAASIGKSLNAWSSSHLQEKIYVHTDKEFYVAGEIMWLKVYCVDAIMHRPLSLSSIAYVEVLDSSSQPLLQGKISLRELKGNGSFFLPVTMPSGNYRLRCYTNWMKNFSSEYFFEKQISIVNTRAAEFSVSTSEPAPEPTAEFFPEGGHFIAGRQNVIGYKITDGYGRGLSASCFVLGQQGDTVLRLRPLKFGMGKFLLAPDSGKSYTMLIVLPGGQKFLQPLPQPEGAGYSLELERTTATSSKLNVYATDDGPVYLVAHSSGVTRIAMAAAVKNGSAAFEFENSRLGEGISHLTVFNFKHEPVAERLFFRYPADPLKLSISTQKAAYNTRDSVHIAVSGAELLNDSAEVSMSVYRMDALQPRAELDINSYLWLSSDLRGSIESPSWYFDETAPERFDAMENLLLTQGWRRFKWADVTRTQKDSLQFAPEVTGHVITGTVIDSRTNQPAAGISAYVAAPGTYTSFRQAESDEKGNVRFDVKNFYGGAELIAQTSMNPDSVYRVEIKSPFSSERSTRELPALVLRESESKDLLQQSISSQVQNVYLAAAQRAFNANAYDTGSFYLVSDEKYPLDNYTRFTTMEEVFREYVRAVNVRKRSSGFNLIMFDAGRRDLFQEPPMVLLDGVPVFNTNKLFTVDPLKLQLVDVVSRKYIYGATAYPGLVNITSYKGDLAGYELDPNAIVLDYEGLQLQREFYSPSYSNDSLRALHLPDFRSTLFWTTSMVLKPNAAGSTSFYTSDLKGKYAVIVSGLSRKGRSGTAIASFEVR